MNSPLVSVILPVHNGERLLAESIQSVLQQDYEPVELIVIDDGSTDGTAQIAAGFADQVRYFYQPTSGAAAARNFGIRKAKGAFIAFIDADDIWPDDKLRMQMRCFEALPSVEIVQGLISRIKLPDLVKGRITGADIDFPFLYTNLGAMLVRRSVFEKIGYLDERLRFNEDTDFWLRAREANIKIAVQRKVSLIYRIHGYNLTTGENLKTMGFFAVLQKSIHRRRSSSGSVRLIRKLPFLAELLESNCSQDSLAQSIGIPMPLVSVVLCIEDHHTQTAFALESIRHQQYHPIELIIAGRELERIQVSFADVFDRVEWVEHESPELASQLNAAIQKCTGTMVTFLIDDGQWTSDKLKSQVKYLLEHPTDQYVVGQSRQIIEPGTKYSSEQIDSLNFRRNLRDQLGTLMVRRSSFDIVGGFTVGLHGMEETDWFLRAQDRGLSKGMLRTVLLYRFTQPDLRAESTEAMKTSLLETVRASVHRKRIERI